MLTALERYELLPPGMAQILQAFDTISRTVSERLQRISGMLNWFSQQIYGIACQDLYVN